MRDFLLSGITAPLWEIGWAFLALSLSGVFLGLHLGRKRYSWGMHAAWGIIQNVSLRDWSKQTREWRSVANQWQRDFILPLDDKLYQLGVVPRLREWWRQRTEIEGSHVRARISEIVVNSKPKKGKA